LAMPTEKGLRGDNRQGSSPVKPVAELDEGKTRGVSRPLRLDVSLLIQRELLCAERDSPQPVRDEGAGRVGGSAWHQPQARAV
jgi:hypothetical protein